MDEKMKNRKIGAIVIIIILLILSFISDGIIARNRKIEKNMENPVKDILSDITENKYVEEVHQGSNKKERILIIPINGVIADQAIPLGIEGYDHNKTLNTLDRVSKDKSIKGIILTVDSPGGTVYHSAQLWKKIKDLKEELDIPIYASMGTVAASGGYYVSAPTDKIFASPDTVTGSIGVIADYINYEELEKKIGIKHNVFKSAEHKDIGSASREMTEEERNIIQSSIDESYEEFLKVVSEGRNMSMEETKKVADGRTFSGKQALEVNLVDELGYLEDTISAMSEDLNLDDPVVFSYSLSPKAALSQLFVSNKEIKSEELQIIKELREVYGMNNVPRLLYIYGGY